MRFGLNVSTMGECANPRALAELAREAEESGWDAFLVWDAIHISHEDWDVIEAGKPDAAAIVDPWIVLAGAAMLTERIILGPIVTPLSRRRPWKVARETATLDHLSNGRVVLPVGLGALNDGGFTRVGEETDRKTRAKMLDESLEILDGLWSGEPFSYAGDHFRLKEMTFRPTPVQSPRIPIWTVAAWPSRTSMRRAIRCDGVMPIMRAENGEFMTIPTPADVREIRDYVRARRDPAIPFDIIIEGSTPGDDGEEAASIVRPHAECGATWWIEAVFNEPGGFEGMRRRIKQGPPQIR